MILVTLTFIGHYIMRVDVCRNMEVEAWQPELIVTMITSLIPLCLLTFLSGTALNEDDYGEFFL